jgi:hypothetical protein
MTNRADFRLTWPRALWTLAVLLLAGPALADTPPTPTAAAPALTDDELRVAYGEVQAIGGIVYTYYLTGSADEAKLDAFVKRLGPAPAASYVETLGLKKATAYAFTLPPILRDVVRTTAAGHLSRKFQLQSTWVVIFVGSAKFTPLPALEQMKEALPKLVQAGAIPAPADTLRPPLAAIYQAAGVRNVEALARLPPESDINVLLPNGMTMLSNAVSANQPDLVTALLDRHADPNKCGAGVCPLMAAVYSPDAPAMLAILLAHGANPDIVDTDMGALSPPLAMAVLQPKGIELSELLLAKGANVDGLPGDLPPLVGAAQKGDRATIEMLLKHGADLYRPAKVAPPTNALTIARGANADAKFQSWLADEWQAVAKRSGRFDWHAAIEQDGKETPIGDKPIVLARKPFNIVVHMRPDARFMVTASTERTVFDDYKDPNREGGMAMHTIAAVVADACTGDQRPLFLSGNSNSSNPALKGDRVMAWEDSAQCHAFTATKAEANGTRYVRTIGSLTTYDGDQPIGTSSIPSLYVVMGTALDTVFPMFDYFGAKQFEIRFR